LRDVGPFAAEEVDDLFDIDVATQRLGVVQLDDDGAQEPHPLHQARRRAQEDAFVDLRGAVFAMLLTDVFPAKLPPVSWCSLLVHDQPKFISVFTSAMMVPSVDDVEDEIGSPACRVQRG